MTKNIIERLLETFFLRWWLYLVPLLLFVGLAVLSFMDQEDRYESVGTLSVSADTLLSDLSALGPDGAFDFETPATVISRRINELLRTDEFTRTVAETAGIADAIDTGQLPLAAVRQSVGAYPDGQNILAVRAVTAFPDVSQRLATATIDGFIGAVLADAVRESSQAIEFYSDRLEASQAEVAAARQELAEWVDQNPEPTDELSALQTIELERLTGAVSRAEADVQSANEQLAAAQLVVEQTEAGLEQQIRLIDAPTVPTAPEPTLRKAVFSAAALVAMGVIITAALTVLAMFLDRTARVPHEVQAHAGVPVLAAVPVGAKPRRRTRIGAS